jgi:hypothetical protein
MLRRIRSAISVIKRHSAVDAPEATNEDTFLTDEAYKAVSESIVPTTVDVLIMCERAGESIPTVVLGKACIGVMKGKLVPISERMHRNDDSPEARACRIVSRLGISVEEREFDVISVSYNRWRTGTYTTFVLALIITEQQLAQLKPTDKYSEIVPLNLAQVSNHDNIPDISRQILTDWRNQAHR